jgi:hypothetical protein
LIKIIGVINDTKKEMEEKIKEIEEEDEIEILRIFPWINI